MLVAFSSESFVFQSALFRNVNIKIHKIVIIPIVLYGV
jgi:hypothetical protein